MRIIFSGGIFTVILATIISWLLTGESSPLNNYLLWNPGLRNFWGMLNFPSYLAGAMMEGNPHNVNLFIAWTVFLVQWFMVGIIIMIIARKILRQQIP